MILGESVACLLICLTALLISATKECTERGLCHPWGYCAAKTTTTTGECAVNQGWRRRGRNRLAGQQDIRTSLAGKTRQSGIVLDLWSSLISLPPKLTLLRMSLLFVSVSVLLSVHSPLSSTPLCPDILTNNFIDGLCLVFNCPASCLSCLNAARDNCSFYDAFIKSVSRLLRVSPFLPLPLSTLLPIVLAIILLRLATDWHSPRVNSDPVCLSVCPCSTVTRHLFARLALTVVDCEFSSAFSSFSVSVSVQFIEHVQDTIKDCQKLRSNINWKMEQQFCCFMFDVNLDLLLAN